MTPDTLLDEFLPTYDVSDAVATIVEAEPEQTWEALMGVDLIGLSRRRPMVGLLGGIRIAPQIAWDLLRGRGLPAMPKRMTLRDTATTPEVEGSWVLLGERDRAELALGLVGQFWRPIIRYMPLGREQFRDYAQPGYAKTIYALSVTGLGDGRTLLRGEMRTATTDEAARRRFRLYWTLGVGSGAHLLVRAVLEQARELAETP